MNPILSIIIADANGMPEINWCLAALEKQQLDETIEVIVVEPGGEMMIQALRNQFPWIRLLMIENQLSIPEMRNLALEKSRGELIAILEDHEVVPPDWCRNMVAAHTAYPEVAAVAGPIENIHPSSITTWAAFFCEYCAFMPPVTSGFTSSVPGNNITYKRWALEISHPEDRNHAFWETSIHPALLKRGCQFRIEPDVTISHQKHFGFFEFIQQRFHYSRYYAGFITRESSRLYRLLRSSACILLPIVLLMRILSCGLSKHRYLKELLLSLPMVFVFTVVWSAGEAGGYLMGAGRSLSLIE